MELTFKDSKLESKENETSIVFTKKDTKLNNQDFYDQLSQRINSEAFECE